MTGGILQLVSKGINDVFLTHEPQITLFKCVYRRHSNFCKIEKRLNFNNKLTFGKKSHCRLKCLADLVNKMYLVVELPEIMIKYQYLTVNKINNILQLVNIRFPFGPEYSSESRITKDFYIKKIIPYIETKINQYIDLINIANNEINIIRSLKNNTSIENIDISKYLYQSDNNQNIENNYITFHSRSNYPILPIKYKIYRNLLELKAKIDPSILPLFNVFDFLINMYNNVDGNKIKIYNANIVKNILYNVAISILFDKKSTYNKLSHISDNYLFLKTIDINDDNIILIQNFNYDIFSFFRNLISNSGIDNDILKNLDLYLIHKKYLNEMNNKNSGNFVKIKNDLVNILSQSLQNNLNQFLTILNIARNFRIEYRNNDNCKISKSMLIYGFFCSKMNIIENYNDRNIFFYDNDYSTLKDGDYYCNFVKTHVNSFFNNLSDIIKKDKFIKYYNDNNYWSYLTLNEDISNPMNLSSILCGKYQLSNISGISKIWLMEFIPFVVLQNLYTIFQNNNIKGDFWTTNFESGYKINEINKDKYMRLLLNPYKTNYGKYKLDTSIYDYLTSRIKNIDNKNYILSHVFCPYTIYHKNDVLTELNVNNENLHYLQHIYGLTNLPNIPDLLLPLDVLLLTIGYDILLAIDASAINPNKIADVKYTAMRILHLYIMSYEELPLHSVPIIDPISYTTFNDISKYVNNDIMNTYNNNIARISSIWNYITRNQMIYYNDLFTNKLLSPDYYKFKNTNTSYQDLGIGSTMQYVYEMFVDHFYKQRLNIVEDISLESILPQTNFYGISYIDPNDNIGKLHRDIYDNLICKMIQLKSNIDNYLDILEVRNINIDPSRYYYNTMFNIMGGGIDQMNFKFDGEISDESQLFVKNIILKTGDIYGYTGQILINDKISKLPSNFVQLFIGECYKALKIVPVPFDMEIKCGSFYTSMYQPLPYKNSNNKSCIIRGVLDLLANFRLLLQSNDNYKDELKLYDSILETLGIYLVTTWDDYLRNYIVTIQDDKQKYNPDINYLQFISPGNNPGNLYNNNLQGFSNSDIATKYSSFDNVYSIIQYLLDLMLQKFNFFDLDLINSKNDETILNTYNKYLDELINRYNKYISLLTSKNNIYNGSYIFNRIDKLLWDKNTHRLAKFAWAKYIGYSIIDELSIKIGGQLIDKHNYKWMYLNYLINKNESLVRGHDIMIGNIPELYSYNNQPKPKHVLYIPIKFWFCENINESLPLLCMRYTDVDLVVKLRNLNEVAWWENDDTFFVKEPSLNCHILADYIYLDTDERKKFATSKHEYLIEYVQYNSSIISSNNLQHNNNNFNMNVILNNICKYLVWTIKFYDSNENRKDNTLNWTDFEYKFDKNAVEDFDIRFNQIERETVKKAGYFNLVQPYEKKVSSLPKNIYLYSFALYPKLLQPSGGVNVDMLDELSITMRLSKKVIENNVKIQCDIYGKQYNILRIMSGMAGLLFY